LDAPSLEILQKLANYQQGICDLVVNIIGNPSPDIRKAYNMGVLEMHSLRSITISPNLPLSGKALRHLGSLPFLAHLSISSYQVNSNQKVTFPYQGNFFPALQALTLRVNSRQQLGSSPALIKDITSQSLSDCSFEFDLHIHPRVSDIIPDLVSLSNALAPKKSLLSVRFHLLHCDLVLGLNDFKNIASPFLPAAGAPGGLFRLWLENIYFIIRNDVALEFYPLLYFACCPLRRCVLFRASTLLTLAKSYGERVNLSATINGLILDRGLERSWHSLEPMPQYEHLAIDADLSRGVIESFRAYVPILRGLFPRLSFVYDPDTCSASEQFWNMITAELGHVEWINLQQKEMNKIGDKILQG
jgi:hypothetical protein